MDGLLPNLLNGLSYSMVLFLIAAGMSIVVGIMGVFNLAHGGLYMLGGYVGWTVAIEYGLNFWLAALAGGLAAGLVGLILERGFLRRLHNQLNEQVLLTFGFVYVITNICLWIWGGPAKMAFTAPELSRNISMAGITYPLGRIAIIIIGGIVAVALWWLLDKTKLGSRVRAGMDDKEMTTGLGINVEYIATLVFLLAAFLAGFAGVIGAKILGVSTVLGMDILLVALIVLIVGGVGSIKGSLVGALAIGLIDAFGRSLFPEFAMFTMYVAMIVILIVKPRGLVPSKS